LENQQRSRRRSAVFRADIMKWGAARLIWIAVAVPAVVVIVAAGAPAGGVGKRSSRRCGDVEEAGDRAGGEVAA
jgi:hypothetical protein